MKVDKHKLAAVWMMWTLVVIIITALATQALAEPERIIEVEYIIMDSEEYEEAYPEEIEVETNEIQEFPMMTLGVYNVSAYCPCEICCGEWADGNTSDGVKAIEGITIAADPEVHPIGTELFIEGVGWRTVQDVGGAIKESRLDIFFGGEDAHQRALEFGRQQLEVFKETEQ